MKQLTTKIRQRLTGFKDSRQVGDRLRRAKGHFDKSRDWLVWAEESFDLGKAHVYRLVKVAEVFGDDSAFDGLLRTQHPS